MRKRAIQSIIVTVLAVLCLATGWMPVSAAETITLPVEVKFGQSEARTMLDMINDFRTGSDAWYWNSSNTEKVYVNAAKLTYDYGLEQIAMRRAVEIALSFSHTRPNGKSCFTASVGSYSAYGENIAAGYATASAVFVGWQETDLPYSGQGHRRNMLTASFTSVGIAHVYVNGRHYWVQEFGIGSSGVAPTAANDGNAVVDVEIDKSLITTFTVEAPKTLTLSVGDSAPLPVANVKIAMEETWPGTPVPVPVTPSWSASGSAVSISGGKINAVGVGSSTLTATVYGEKITVTVNVECTNHKWGSWTTTKAATCTASGTETRQCSVCKTEETRAIPATGHKMGAYKVTKAATCTEAGVESRQCSVCKTEESRTIPATGHKMGPYKVVKEATEEENGLEERSCDVCGQTEQRAIEKLPPEGAGETASVPDTNAPENTTPGAESAPTEGTTSGVETTSPEVTVPGGEIEPPEETSPSETVSSGEPAPGAPITGGDPDSDASDPKESAAATEKEDSGNVPATSESVGAPSTSATSGNPVGSSEKGGDAKSVSHILIAAIVVLAIVGGVCIVALYKRKRK